MLANIALGSILIVLTTAVHAVAMSVLLWQLRRTHASSWGARSSLTRVTLIAGAVVFLFLASFVEVLIWSATYLASGALSEVEPAIYFSMVSFTSLGYGDIVLPPEWRLLSSFESANGIVMFGWTTALIFALVQRLYFPKR